MGLGLPSSALFLFYIEMRGYVDYLVRQNGESDFEWKLRLIKYKLVEKQDIEWQEICNILGVDCSADHLRKTAYGIMEYDNYLKTNGVATRILSISDTHVPFQLPLETFKDYIGKVDILQLNGDISDCQSISKFSKKYRVNFVEEMIETRQYIIDLIEYIKPKKVVINYGNHELRYQKYLSDKIHEDLLQLMPNTSLDMIIDIGFKNYDRKQKTEIWYEPIKNVFDIEIEYTKDWKCKIGKTWFAHPKTFSSGMLKTTEKAVDYFLRMDRDFDTVVLAHTHKLGSFVQGGVYLYEQGCCCKSDEMDYMDGLLTMPQQQGFIYVCQNDNGELIFDKTKLVKLNK
jgi:predicted phosphodiesterase